MSLDYRYFENLHEAVSNDVLYRVIRPLNSPMILFSTCDPRGPIPLAAVHFLAQSYNDDRGKTMISQRWRNSPMVNCDFQGLINKDNQDYEFVITNLTTGNDFVNINILKKNVPVVEVNPGVKGHGLNQVNELKPFESYSIQCDQKDNCSLVLRSIKNSTGQHVTVQNDEQQGVNQAKGTYYYLSVVGQSRTPTAELFKETIWSTVDYFIQMIPMPKFTISSRGGNDTYERQSALYIPGSFKPESCEMKTSMPMDMDQVVAQSHAATVDSGRYIDVRSGETGVTYDFDHPSAPCCLGLSICEGLTFYPSPSMDRLMDGIIESIKDYHSHNAKAYLDRLKTIYKDENCCLCLEANPDVVLYQCGHQCCHQACLKKEIQRCPLCRQTIGAKINLK